MKQRMFPTFDRTLRDRIKVVRRWLRMSEEERFLSRATDHADLKRRRRAWQQAHEFRW